MTTVMTTPLRVGSGLQRGAERAGPNGSVEGVPGVAGGDAPAAAGAQRAELRHRPERMRRGQVVVCWGFKPNKSHKCSVTYTKQNTKS